MHFSDGGVFCPEKLLRHTKSPKVTEGENDVLELVAAAHLDES
ncbi:hypothetical protein [Streptomyces sp. NPDC052036]